MENTFATILTYKQLLQKLKADNDDWYFSFELYYENLLKTVEESKTKPVPKE